MNFSISKMTFSILSEKYYNRLWYNWFYWLIQALILYIAYSSYENGFIAG